MRYDVGMSAYPHFDRDTAECRCTDHQFYAMRLWERSSHEPPRRPGTIWRYQHASGRWVIVRDTRLGREIYWLNLLKSIYVDENDYRRTRRASRRNGTW